MKTDSATEPVPALSPKEAEVFRYIGLGMTNHEIAAQCGNSHNTIQAHLERIKLKRRFAHMRQLIVAAAKANNS